MEPCFYVRNVPIYGDVILSPMAGYSDVPYRAICRAYGSAMNYTEFVASEEILAGHKRAWAKLDYTPEDRPVVFQICSNSGYYMRRKRDGYIDVHRGCSTRKVSGRG